MKSLFKIASKLGFRQAQTKPDQVSYQIFGFNSKHPSCVFTIGHKIAETMRWIQGDRIDVLYDQELAEGQLTRCPSGGWQLCNRDKETSPCRVRIGYRKEFGLPMTEEKVDLAIDVTNNTIVFAFPIRFRQAIPVTGKVTITAGGGK